MGRYYRNTSKSNTIAIGIQGDRHSLCGAIKRFELYGKQSNKPLSLKEQCARHIALIKHEQIKSFITGYVPPHLFTYVTKDIFDLRRQEFKENYPTDCVLCEECSIDTYETPSGKCQCPNVERAISILNKRFFKQQRRRRHQNNQIKRIKQRKFELVYKIPDYEICGGYDPTDSIPFFLYLSPALYYADVDSDEDDMPFDNYNLIHSKISARTKLLFVDVMRFFDGFLSYFHEAQLVFYRRCEIIY